MNFSTGRNTGTSQFRIEYLGSYEKTGTCSVYERKTATVTEILIYTTVFSNAGLPTTPETLASGKFVRIPKAMLTEQSLLANNNNGTPEFQQVASFTGIIPYFKYRFHCNSIYDLRIVAAHYGQYYVGGIEFELKDLIASTDSNYAYCIEFNVIDLLRLQSYAKFSMLSVVQNLSFDIANYAENRRVEYSTVFSDSKYSKLALRLSLSGSALRIVCQDTTGNSASSYVQNQLGLSDTTMTCIATVQMRALNEAGENIQEYTINIANLNYDDEPILAYLPDILDDAVIIAIYVDYSISLYTTQETITLNSQLILTDQQIAALRPLHISDL